MNNLPIRKKMRLEGYDYSSSGAYFVTLCVIDRQALLWDGAGANCVLRPEPPKLSQTGRIIELEIQRLNNIYASITVDKYCIMPDHIHMIILITHDESMTQPAPTLSRIIKQFKGSITKQIGYSIWQKSFHDKVIRDEKGYREAWKYIDSNQKQSEP